MLRGTCTVTCITKGCFFAQLASDDVWMNDDPNRTQIEESVMPYGSGEWIMPGGIMWEAPTM